MVDGLAVGMKLHAVYSADGEYYPAVISAISKSKKRARAPVKVSFVGYDTEEWKPLSRLKLQNLSIVEAKVKAYGKAKAKSKAKGNVGASFSVIVDGLAVGMKIHAVYSADGEYYPAVISAISKSNKRARAPIKVLFAGYDTEEWKPLSRLKLQNLSIVEAKVKAYGKAKATAKAKGKVGTSKCSSPAAQRAPPTPCISDHHGASNTKAESDDEWLDDEASDTNPEADDDWLDDEVSNTGPESDDDRLYDDDSSSTESASNTKPESYDDWLDDEAFHLERLQHLDWLRDEHPGLDSDGLEDMYQEMMMADAEEFAGEYYNSD